MGLEELVSFFDYAKETGTLPANAIHNLSGAVSAISHCLQYNERSLDFVQNNRDLLRVRIATHKPGISPQTIDAYLNRLNTAISHFLVWKKDPQRWEKEMSSKPQKRRRRRMVVRPSEKTLAPTRVENGQSVVAPRNSKSVIHIPTEQGMNIVLELPETISMNDVYRLMWAAAVHTKDFNPESLLKRVGKPATEEAGLH